MAKTELELAKEGVILKNFNQNAFISVSGGALNIGKVLWNGVPIGKGGQNDIRFYMNTDQMLALCAEILDGTFAKKIAADAASAYPSAYKYVTGADGHLHLNIGGGKKGCRIQFQNAKTKTNYMILVSMDDMYTMARKYMLYTGLTPVMPNTYYASVVAAFEAGRAERAKFHKPNDDELGDVINENSVIDESTLEENTNHASATPAHVEDVPAKKNGNPPVVDNFSLVVHGAKTLMKGFYVFEGVDDKGNNISLMFRKEDADKLAWFEKFENTAAMGDTPLKIVGEKKDNYILYKGPIQK